LKVLVTGATGFVGRHFVARLVESGHDVTVLTRAGLPKGLFPWEGRVRREPCDLATAPFQPHWAEHDALAHLAWPDLPHYTRPAHVETTLPAHFAFINGLVAKGMRQVLVTGTCFEYGLREGRLSESLETDPRSPYSLAKDTLRKSLEALQRDSAFRLQWARLFYTYGDGQHPNSLFSQLDRAILEGHDSFDMTGGEQLRDYLPVGEVARALVNLLEHGEAAGVVNICSGKPVTVRSLVEERVRQSGSHIRLNLGALSYSALEPMAFWGDDSRLAAMTGRS
jgi:nucleoside-diphosphate-sugar epimerase